MRDHVFISYAVEQAPIAEWLARRLASLGYAVWMDRLKLLGGEPWPQDIQRAIRERTFCMLALLSRASQAKQNPVGEWLVAQAVAKELERPDFLIPLKVEDLKASEISFTFQTTNYITFTRGWASGLASVVKKLEALDAPRSLRRGPELASIFYDVSELVRPEPERLHSNCLVVRRVPLALHRFECRTPIPRAASIPISLEWPHYWIDPNRAYSFQAPPRAIAEGHRVRNVGSASWRHASDRDTDGVRPSNIATALLRRSVNAHFAAKRLVWSPEKHEWYFPQNLVKGNWLPFTHPDQQSRKALAVGSVTLRSRGQPRPLRYHLSPSMTLLRETNDPFVFAIRLRVHITETNGHPVEGRSLVTARKKVCKSWWNDKWFARVLGVCEFLSTSPGQMVIGSTDESAIVIESTPLSVMAPVRLIEEQAEPLAPEEIVERDDYEDDPDDDEGGA